MAHTEIQRLDYAPIPISLRWQNVPDDPGQDDGIKIRAMRQQACSKEPWTAGFIESMPEGGVLYDLGANVGSYTLLAAARGHRVVAFEPSAINFERLVVNIFSNNLDESIVPIMAAIGKEDYLDWLHLSTLSPGAASHILGQPLPSDKQRAFWHRIKVPVLKLDTAMDLFKLPPPTHIKIDTDGGEGQVLKGADKALAFAQAIMLEMKDTLEARLIEILAEKGFNLAQRFADRNGVPIQGVSYGYFVR